MNRLFTVLGLAFLGLTATNCNKDDGGGAGTVVQLRDRTEVKKENDDQIKEFLKNNYMIIDGENVTFDSISSPNGKDKTPLINDKRIKIEYEPIRSDNYEYEANRNPNGSTTLRYTKPKDTLTYSVAYFIVPDINGNKQTGTEHYITTIDSVYVKTKSYSLKNESFHNNGSIGSYYSFPMSPLEFNYMSQGNYNKIPSQLKTAERQILTKVKTATGIQLGNDGKYTYDKGTAGRIIAIIPSGVGYFNAGYGGKLKPYHPHIIDMTLIARTQRDHDGDGILSKYEVKEVIEQSAKIGRALTDEEIRNLNLKIEDYFNFDTDGDGIPNFLDDDDDGDGVLTKTELLYKDSNDRKAYYNFYDPILKTCSDVFRYLDRTCFPDQKDGEVIWPQKK